MSQNLVPKFYQTLKQKSQQTLDDINTTTSSESTKNEIFKHNLNVLSELCDRMLNIDNTTATTSLTECANNSKQLETKRNAEHKLKTHSGLNKKATNKPRKLISDRLYEKFVKPMNTTTNDEPSSSVTETLQQQKQTTNDIGIDATFDEAIKIVTPSQANTKANKSVKKPKQVKTRNCERVTCAQTPITGEKINLTYSEKKPRGRPKKKSIAINSKPNSPQVSNDVITLE